MASAGLLISLPQMVEMAIGSPEIGAVNFNLLAAALQVIIQQLKLDSYTVDFRGPDVERMQGLLAATKPGLSLKISEGVRMDSSTILAKEETIISTTEQRRNSKEEPKVGGIKKSGKVIIVEPSNKREITSLPQVVVGVSQELFVQINNDVEDLKSRMHEMMQLATNETILKAIRAHGHDKVTPAIDMWQALSIAKRLESAETGMEKLAGMFENLVHEIGGKGSEGTGNVLADIANRINTIEQKLMNIDAGSNGGYRAASGQVGRRVSAGGNLGNSQVSVGGSGGGARVSVGGSAAGPRASAGGPLQSAGSQVLAGRVPRASAGGETDGAGGAQFLGGSPRATAGSDPDPEPTEVSAREDFDPEYLEEIATDVETLKSQVRSLEEEYAKLVKGFKGKNLGDLYRDVEEIKRKLPSEEEEGAEGSGAAKGGIDEELMNELELKFTEIATKLDNLDESYASQLQQQQDQLLNIEKELGVLNESNNTKADVPTDAQSIGDLFAKIVKLQEGLEGVSKQIERINEEQDERTLNMDALTEQVELLKTTKADREDLEDALAEKADNQQVNRKVSTLQFDAACEGLTRHIEDTMKKLSEQEEMWQATLIELQMTIGSKLDKQEFDPLKDFVNKKIKCLQQRLKALVAMKQEQEAAGSKSKVLKNVNCISCDRDVIMFKENKFSTFPKPPIIPGNRSIKPYITYELDAVRKQQKSFPPGRNMNHLESAIQDTKKDKPVDKAIPAGHLCNRYCGGSHTMTQPQQRVAHIGHFLNQWGPQAIPLDEGTIMGTDGQVYKAREAGALGKPGDDHRRLSAQNQTDPKERIARMSSTLENSKRSGRKQSASKGTDLEPVKEEQEEGRKARKSSSAKKASSTPRGSKKSLKRSSIGEKKEAAHEDTSASDHVAPSESDATETVPASEEEA